MLKRLNKRSGNKYTMISIIFIILMMYFFKISLGGNQVTYPQSVYFNDHKYEYSQTIRAASVSFIRKYGVSYEGNILLLKRGDGDLKVPDKVYIFTNWQKYREYQLVQ